MRKDKRVLPPSAHEIVSEEIDAQREKYVSEALRLVSKGELTPQDALNYWLRVQSCEDLRSVLVRRQRHLAAKTGEKPVDIV